MTLEVLFARAAQCRAFLLAAALGVAAGALVQSGSWLGRIRGWLGAAADALAAVFMGAALLASAYTGGEGLRFYSVLGLVIGLLLYTAGVRPLAAWVARGLKKFCPAGRKADSP